MLEKHSEFTIEFFLILFIKYHIFVGLCTKLICIKLYFVILNIIISLLLQFSDTIDVHKRLTTEGIQRGLATIHCYDNVASFLGTGRSHGTCNPSRLLTTKLTKFTFFGVSHEHRIKHLNYSLNRIFIRPKVQRRMT